MCRLRVARLAIRGGTLSLSNASEKYITEDRKILTDIAPDFQTNIGVSSPDDTVHCLDDVAYEEPGNERQYRNITRLCM